MIRYAIGEFSRIIGTNTRMLRHYKGIGLLFPDCVGNNLYRYYKENQIALGLLIAKLISIDVLLKETLMVLESAREGNPPRKKS
ncbi:MAG: MerR family transcriptional regulator [Caldisericales bacterium]|nr:MerR family transcriptional regulator [Caldisericales bacterium]